ncbi:N-acetylmuramoyl-L-alanine amidase [Streptomyces sp. NPDC048720]|uniref:peptidoglycan recognition protein family protein n=1 Tax=Streptomyces sp. NPDC048720 TaxID=3365588 RepID=UPI00371F273D
MTAKQFVDLLNEWGIPHRENRDGWQNHNRNSKGPWGPNVFGIGNHHTGGADNKAGRDILWEGYAALPGPLCHAGIQQDGYVLLNGWGRVNHFGLGDSKVLGHVIKEDYGNHVLVPHQADVDGNSRFYGFEWMYDGLSEPSEHYPKLYHTAVRLNAAICTHHDWTELSAIGHGEWQPGKWDPGHSKGHMFDTVKFRGHVAQAIAEGPKGSPKPQPSNSIVFNKGDSLHSLAKKFLGDEKRWLEFVDVNRQLLNHPEPGDVLKLPKK